MMPPRAALLLLLLASAGCTTQTIPDLDTGPPQRDAGADSGPSCDNGVRDGDEPHVDCGGSCEPCADGSNCISATDCASLSCSRGFCLAPSCSDRIRNGLETGTDCGADCGLCPGGESCTSNDQCISGRCMAGGVCAPSSCEDGRRNDEETDVDCGGPTCPPCAAGRVCREDAHCESRLCEAGFCAEASCSDRVQNQDETSIDCGGVTCPPCRDGLACVIDVDCVGMRCVSGACVSCMDRVQNAEETDVDCGGGLCSPCRDLLACVTGSDCASGRCLDGTCISCSDLARNGDETDVDCGGTVCWGCGTGLGCVIDADCLSNDCAGGTCLGAGDDCSNPWELSTGLNIVSWVASNQDYVGLRPSCALSDSTGPDLVLSYTATVNGVVTYDIEKPASTRWTLVVSSGTCGSLAPEVECNAEYTSTFMRGQFPVTAGTTYYFYLVDTITGTMPLSLPLRITLGELVPPCTPGAGGVVGTTTRRLATGLTSIAEYYVAVDSAPSGYVYFGGASQLYRIPKAGGARLDVHTAAAVSTPLGYEMVIAGLELFVLDTIVTGTTNRVFRISSDGGGTWHTGGQSYATFPVSPADDFAGAAAYGGTLYMITNESTTTVDTEIWSVPTGATSLPAAATRLGAIPFRYCSGLAADASYLYTVCYGSHQIVRVDRATMAATVVASVTGTSSLRNAIAASDTNGDGLADVLYTNLATETVYYTCGLGGSTPFTDELVSWGIGTSNYGLAFDAATNTLYALDDDAPPEIIEIR